MHKILVIRIYFQYKLYMFRTVLVHLQEQTFYKLYVVFGICGYVWLLCCYARRMVPAYTKYDIQLIKRLLLKMD